MIGYAHMHSCCSGIPVARAGEAGGKGGQKRRVGVWDGFWDGFGPFRRVWVFRVVCRGCLRWVWWVIGENRFTNQIEWSIATVALEGGGADETIQRIPPIARVEATPENTEWA